MKETKSPAFQFYVKDWLSSALIQMMPPEYEGAYIRLLAYCWDSGDCSLPDDDAALAQLSRLGEGWLKGGCQMVRKCFIPHPKKEGFLTNERLLFELEKQQKWRKKSAEGGKNSAAKRAKNAKHTRVVEEWLQPNPQPNGNQGATLQSSSSSSSALEELPNGNSISESSKNEKVKKVKKKPDEFILPTWLIPYQKDWDNWLEMRKIKKVPATYGAMEIAVNKLQDLNLLGHDPDKVLQQSTFKGWQGLFPVKDDFNGGNNSGTVTKDDRAKAAIMRGFEDFQFTLKEE